MDTKEIIKKVKLLEIKTRKLVNSTLMGYYHSSFKGQGIEFHEVREYNYGDDVRNIDWNVSARMGFPYVKNFIEERELNVILVVDRSGSMFYGSGEQTKIEISIELASLLAFSALKNKDRVGLMIFDDGYRFIPPKAGKSHVMRIIRELLTLKPYRGIADPSNALASLARMLKRRAIIFFISDLIYADTFEKELSTMSVRHDFIVVYVRDENERIVPRVRYIEVEDAETGAIKLLDLTMHGGRLNTIARDYEKRFFDIFKRYAIDRIDITPSKPYINELIRLFKKRASVISR